MDVVSVYCGEDICKVDPVRLHWDRLGFYQHYSLKKGITLEKAQGLDFTDADYDKLETVLKNKASGLATLYKDELVRENPSGNAVDALSGATVAILKDDYVDGAIWTCYTLWHFANGELTTIIRNITGDSLSTKALNKLLLKGSRDEQLFAIEQLNRKQIHDSTTVSNVLKQAYIDNKVYHIKIFAHQAVIDYVNTLPATLYFNAIETLLISKVDEVIVLALKSLNASPHQAPENFYDQLSAYLPLMSSYQQVNEFFTIINNKQVISSEIISNVYQLLKHNRFAVARSAYWFLNEQTLPAEIQHGIDEFYQKNAKKL